MDLLFILVVSMVITMILAQSKSSPRGKPGTGPEIKVELLFYEEGVGLSQEEQQQRRMTEDYDSGHGGEPGSFDWGCGEKEDREEEKEQEEAEEEEEEEYPPEILVLGREEEVVEVEEETDQERQLVYWPPVPIELEDGEEDPEPDEKEEEESDVEKEEDEGKDENVGGEEEDLLGALTLGPDDIGESKKKQQKEPQPEYGSLIEISDWVTVSREGDADEDVEETELVEEDDDPSYDEIYEPIYNETMDFIDVDVGTTAHIGDAVLLDGTILRQSLPPAPPSSPC